ncbi:MAG: hypothetical protein GXP53_14930 [Deltaproteobacteria bacterium]|nr:hypothetical protein [Deltaproteobacteria bacterium]
MACFKWILVMCAITCLLMVVPVGASTADENAEYQVIVDADNDCSDGVCDLQSALDAAANDGQPSTVRVAAGIYPPSDAISCYPSDNTPLYLTGEGTDATVLSCSLVIDSTGFPDGSGDIFLDGISFSGEQEISIYTSDADITLGDIQALTSSFEVSALNGDIDVTGSILCYSISLGAPTGGIDCPSCGEGGLPSGVIAYGNHTGGSTGLTIGSGIIPAQDSGGNAEGNVHYGVIDVSSLEPYNDEWMFTGGGLIITNPDSGLAYLALNILEGKTITLNDPDLSSDDNGVWVQRGGPAVALSDSAALRPTFVAPAVDGADVNLVFERVVSPGSGDEITGHAAFIVQDNNIAGFPENAIPFETVVSGKNLAIKAGNSQCHVTRLESVLAQGTKSPGRPDEMPYGLVDMDIRVDAPGDTAVVSIYFPEAVPEEYGWFKYNETGGWHDYGAHAVFSADRTSVTLTLVDGGAGDDDGEANGIILDPSGVGSPPASESGSGGGGGCFIQTLH